MTSPVLAQPPDVAPVMSRERTDIPGKEVVMLTVEYPPGGSEPVHRHDAHGLIYVLEGSVVRQGPGGKLTPIVELFGIAHRGYQRRGRQWANARNGEEPLALGVVLSHSGELLVVID